MSSEIKILKLSTGEEIIAEVDEIGDFYKCTNPMAILSSERQLIFVPYMQYSNAVEEFTIAKTFVMLVVDPIDQLTNDYSASTSKIIAPRKTLITPR